ncbi:hypothetical protein Tco_0715091 [Tanacetum coccineum]
MSLPRRTPPAVVCRRTPPAAVFRRLPPPSLPISRWNDRLPPALPYFSLITICCQPLLPYQHDAHDCASKVPFGTHVDVQATNLVLLETFPDDVAHHSSSPPATITLKLLTNPQPNSL